jgi:hypothetical protein
VPTSLAKSLRTALALALALLVVVPAFGSDVGEARDPDAPVYCVQAWPEARYRNYGYDHIVHIFNGCKLRADCTVATNVAPKAIRVQVAPGEHAEVLTFRGSPSSEFQMYVSCELVR